MTRTLWFLVTLTVVAVTNLSSTLSAITVPQQMNYQGRLTNTSGTPLTGNYSLTLTIYDDSLATTPTDIKWQESHPNVTVNGGLFNIVLGAGNPAVPLTEGVFLGEPRYLDIKVAGDPSARPRIRIVSVAYAFAAQNSDTANITMNLKLPFSDTADYSGSAFVISNTGGGSAAQFRVKNSSSASPALQAVTNGTAEAVFGKQTGCYVAGQFQIDNPSCNHAALVGFTNGGGSGVYGWTTGVGSAVRGETHGSGFAGEFINDNSSSNMAALSSYTNGNGPGFLSRTVGSGRAGNLVIDNPSNGMEALNVSTNGSGPAALFQGGNVGIRTTDATSSLDLFGVTGFSQLRLRSSYTPSGTNDPNGNVGDVAWDSSYLYIKTNAGWKRTALGTW